MMDPVRNPRWCTQVTPTRTQDIALANTPYNPRRNTLYYNLPRRKFKLRIAEKSRVSRNALKRPLRTSLFGFIGGFDATHLKVGGCRGL